MDSETHLDIIVFGATGDTGKYVVEYLTKIIEKEDQSLTWGVAGRGEAKTREVLKTVSSYLGKNLDEIPVIIADVKDEVSILRMCKQARIIINCVGPYTLYGEVVIKSCIQAKSNYVDICGEPYFLENMQLKYHDKATEAGVLIVGSCGFGSIPIDVGMMHMQKICSGEVAWINTFAKIGFGPSGGTINIGAWETALQVFADESNFKRVRRELYELFYKKTLPTYKYTNSSKLLPHYPQEVGKLTIPSKQTDKFVVERTQLQNFIESNKRPIQLSSYLVIGSWFNLMKLGFIAFLCGFFIFFKCGRRLLKNHPSFFTMGYFTPEGSTREQINEGYFEITMTALGWKRKMESPTEEPESPPENLMIARWCGGDSGFIATPIFLICAAITILKDKHAIAYKGGLLTPGLVFQDTMLIERLKRNGIDFEITKQGVEANETV